MTQWCPDAQRDRIGPDDECTIDCGPAMTVGVFPLARVTFDLDLAHGIHRAIMERLGASQHRILGGEALLTTTDAFVGAFEKLMAAGIETALILQLTFTDAEAIEHLGQTFAGSLSIWGVPEARTGGHLRLNSFCGLHLASHSLSRLARGFRWHFGAPEALTDAMLTDLLAGEPIRPLVPDRMSRPTRSGCDPDHRIGVIGAPPDGFSTCRYDAQVLERDLGVSTVAIDLQDLFSRAEGLEPDRRASLQAEISTLDGYAELAETTVGKSLDLTIALDDLIAEHKLDGIALRCWPETFTEFGAAACAAASLLGEDRIPCACECDVYGACSQLVLNAIADAPSFLADIVDMDAANNSGVIWHCGQAPASMCRDESGPRVTVHSNRREPLLFEFPLQPGTVTLMRISQSHGAPKLILFAGTVLDAPLAFSGTCGPIRFERTVADLLPDILASGLEHHVAMTYGDHRPALRAWARGLGLPVLEL